MIIQTDILIGSIFHTKTFRYRSNLHKAQSFVQMTSMNIIFHYSIELQNSKAMLLCLRKTISYQFFTDMLATTICSNSVTCICNMPAAADIVWMQDIESHDFSIVICNTTICLCSKKVSTCFIVQKIFLWKSLAIFHNIISDINHCRNVFFRILSDFHYLSSAFRFAFPFISENGQSQRNCPLKYLLHFRLHRRDFK